MEKQSTLEERRDIWWKKLTIKIGFRQTEVKINNAEIMFQTILKKNQSKISNFN